LQDIKIARTLALPLLARFGNCDINIRHHHTGDRMRINAFKHKGYWYFGRQRDHDVMASFKRLIHEADTVIEVGGHVGYVSIYFAKLVGNSGRVFVFEPGVNNLPYAVRNLKVAPNIVLIPKAVSRCDRQVTFYLEDLTGQNNSLVKDFWAFGENVKNAHVHGQYREEVVESVTLDRFIAERNLAPKFIKIDVEGAELEVLHGAINTIERYKPMLMVEVNVKHKEVYDFVRRNDYLIFDNKLNQLEKYQETGMPNVFCLHRKQAQFLERSDGVNHSRHMTSPEFQGEQK
jgi:FkbM family methyltransferase